ncbi:hypothetical protein [Streptosporangium minutum]|uniref:hypothetical protein n=1 Tax=Streptosporangium minutum TaxID=569862 RepID=UPI0010556953|nr:hypothetical protein [Streptosporangium minutum]
MSIVRNSLPTVVTLLIVSAFGMFGTGIATAAGYLAVPSAVGLPYGLPGLRLVPLGETGWAFTLTENLAALVLAGVVAWVTVHRRGGAVRAFFAGWGAFALGAGAAGLLRAVAVSQTVEAGPGAYAGLVLGALAAGLIWGVILGWAAGIATLASVGAETAPVRA